MCSSNESLANHAWSIAKVGFAASALWGSTICSAQHGARAITTCRTLRFARAISWRILAPIKASSCVMRRIEMSRIRVRAVSGELRQAAIQRRIERVDGPGHCRAMDYCGERGSRRDALFAGARRRNHYDQSQIHSNTRLEVRKTIEVPTFTLAQVLEFFSLRRVRYCKIDAEGSEIAILQTLTPHHLAMIDSFAAEIHPEAYSTRELAETILAWASHQTGFNDERDFPAPIIRLISNRSLLDGIPLSYNGSTD